jgi:hypothetical protein
MEDLKSPPMPPPGNIPSASPPYPPQHIAARVRVTQTPPFFHRRPASASPGFIAGRCAGVLSSRVRLLPSGTSGTMYLFSGKSHEKIVQKKDPGNISQCAGSAGIKTSGHLGDMYPIFQEVLREMCIKVRMTFMHVC